MEKGQIYKFRNFPKIDFVIVAEGRLQVEWFQQSDQDSAMTSSTTETLFIWDHLD